MWIRWSALLWNCYICKLRFLQWANSRVELAIPIWVNICSYSYFKTADSMLSVSVSWLMLAFVGYWFLELCRPRKSALSFCFHAYCAHALRNVKWTRIAHHGTQVQTQRFGFNKQKDASVEETGVQKAKGDENAVGRKQGHIKKWPKKKSFQPLSGKLWQNNCCR